MKPILDIITVTKDDLYGVAATIVSTRKLRACAGTRQIIVDSSNAPVAEKVRELLVGEENLEYFWQEPCGIASAFNFGISHSTADWIWFINGRDMVHPDLAESILLKIINLSNADVLIFQIELMQAQIKVKRPPLWAIWPPIYWVPHPATLIRTKLFEQYGTFNNEYKISMDGDLWMRLFSKDICVDMISIPVVLYDQNGVSSTSATETRHEVRKIIRSNIRMLLRVWIYRGLYLFRLFKPKH
jgi:glycosyltransferase involved in cell wall biosynthesis